MNEQSRANSLQNAPTPRRELPTEARRQFWNFVQNDGEERTLYLEGAIADGGVLVASRGETPGASSHKSIRDASEPVQEGVAPQREHSA